MPPTIRAHRPVEVAYRSPRVGPNRIVTEDPHCEEVPLGALDDHVTPTERYFVRNHLPVPTIRSDDWELSLEGLFRHPLTLRYSDLVRLPKRTLVVTTECAGNSRSRDYPEAAGVRWRDGAVGTAEWTGFALRDVLDRAGLRDDAREIVLEGADQGIEEGVEGPIRYAMSLPVEKALDPDTLLAVSMNGAPLTASHGFPVRAVVPGWYGMASVKWITSIRAISTAFDGHYRARTYVVIREGDPPERPHRLVTVLRVKSLIVHPAPGSTVVPGRHRVSGVAWSGAAPIARVEVRATPLGANGSTGGWQESELVGPREKYAWVRWQTPVELTTPGYYVLRARATDAVGNVQPLDAPWNFRGVETNSVHAVPIIVRADARADAPD
jgi:DMSO/TMAO reductase YedYZ molybdopterin-dependent catalytic subunit